MRLYEVSKVVNVVGLFLEKRTDFVGVYEFLGLKNSYLQEGNLLNVWCFKGWEY